MVFDTNGELVLTSDAEGQPKKIKYSNGNIYLLLEGKVCKINIDNGDTVYYDTERNAIDLFIVNEKSALVCYSDHTYKISIE